MARRFRFRLATLLRIRKAREREAKRNVGAKRAEIARVDQLNQQTAAEITSQQQLLLAEQQAGQFDPVALQRGRAWLAHLRRTIAERHVQRTALVAELEQLQAVLRDARTQTRVLEKLRERRLADYRRDRNRREQALADELAQQLHACGQPLMDGAT